MSQNTFSKTYERNTLQKQSFLYKNMCINIYFKVLSLLPVLSLNMNRLKPKAISIKLIQSIYHSDSAPTSGWKCISLSTLHASLWTIRLKFVSCQFGSKIEKLYIKTKTKTRLRLRLLILMTNNCES